MYNKHNQHYEVLGRFRVSETDYTRIKFTATKHEQIVLTSKLNTGDFSDDSIIAITPSKVKPITKIGEIDMIEVESGLAFSLPTKEEKDTSFEKLVEAIDEADIDTVSPTTLEEPTSFEVIATNPKGKDLTLNSLELEEFCAENKLDYDVVIQVLEGHQKTHRKWRFKRV